MIALPKKDNTMLQVGLSPFGMTYAVGLQNRPGEPGLAPIIGSDLAQAQSRLV